MAPEHVVGCPCGFRCLVPLERERQAFWIGRRLNYVHSGHPIIMRQQSSTHMSSSLAVLNKPKLQKAELLGVFRGFSSGCWF